jgi:peptidoglycan/LPS O-acetylase OafA/YrhL
VTSRGLIGPRGKFLDSALMQSAGRISLGIYLYRLLIMSLVLDAVPRLGLQPFGRGPLLFAIGFSLTLCAASLSWVVLEKPMNELKRYFPYAGRTAPRGKEAATWPAAIRRRAR